MSRRRTPPAAVALLAVLAVVAMLTAGCSTGSSDDAGSPTMSVSSVHPGSDPDPDQSAPDQSAPDQSAPDADAPDDDGDAATLDPAFAKGTAVSALHVRGYPATISVLDLPTAGPPKKPWIEKPKPHLIDSDAETTAQPVQTKPPTGTPPALKVDVDGLNYSGFGAGFPPDTSGAVGPRQFVQTVNTSIGIFAKSGTRLNAFSYNSFFGSFHTGTPCDNQNGGDVQVIFDRPANRWIIADLAYPVPYYFCMAVSQGPNITSQKWTIYPFLASETELNDYPKIGSGPDGLYLTSNMFGDGGFDGVQVWAFQRASLGTASLNVQTVRTSNRYGSLLPANSYAATETSGPEYLTSLLTSIQVGLWSFSVNWTHPRRSEFTQFPTPLDVRPYVSAAAVQQLDGDPLDTLSDRAMYQLQLNDGTLWFNHSVQVGDQSAVRWYQIGNLATRPKVLQQGTFAPADGLSRWMGSLAVDKDGNMALGYSVSSATTYPGIRYATRLAADPRNQLTAEGTIVDGTGSQSGIDRWGDYSQMSLDPTDGCTMWYTDEYYTGSGSWSTRIASFAFPSCT